MKDFLGYQNFNKRNGYLAVSLITFIGAITNLFAPPTVRPTGGRWGWLDGLLWDWFGTFGEFYFSFVLTVIFFICFLRTKK